MNGQTTQTKSPPRARWYVLSIALLVLGAGLLIGTVVWFIGHITGVSDGMQRVTVPGSHVIHLDKPAEYTIYHEYRTTHGGRVYSTGPGSLSGLTVEIVDPSGAMLPVSPPGGSYSYNVNGVSGVAILEFYASAAGDYQISGAMPSGAGPSGPAVLAVGRGMGGAIAKGIIGMFVGLGVGILLGLAGLVSLIVLLVIRSGRKNSPAMATAVTPGPPQGPPVPPAPGGRE